MDSTTAASAMEPDADAYNAFVDGLELAGIDLVEISGERGAAGIAAETRFDLSASYLQEENTIHYRYDVVAHITDEDGSDLGRATASVLVTARVAATAESVCIERFGSTSGAFIAYPYLREAIASTSQRLGFPYVLLPMIKSQPDGSAGSVNNAPELLTADTDAQIGLNERN